jgi:AcrR family transcriptional regulator
MKSKKERVLEVATQLFSDNGFETTSVANICEQALLV